MIRLWVCWSVRVFFAVGYLVLHFANQEAARTLAVYAAIGALVIAFYDFWRWRRDTHAD